MIVCLFFPPIEFGRSKIYGLADILQTLHNHYFQKPNDLTIWNFLYISLKLVAILEPFLFSNNIW